MIPARQIFESFAASSPASPPPDPIDAAQVYLAAWEADPATRGPIGAKETDDAR